MNNKFLDQKGKIILLGNEAVVRGALEAGIRFASNYPGTPASEIGDTFAKISKQSGVYFEQSVNEKVAAEAAIGASLSGLKSMVSFKHFGLNVASDSLIPTAYIEPEAGFVIAFADDPNCWSSLQSEQDSRYYARIANIPMLEPSTPQECKDFTKLAFELSEKFKIPVFLRLTTRTCYTGGPVELKNYKIEKAKGKFNKNPEKFFTLAPRIIEIHKEVLSKLEKISDYLESSELNQVIDGKVSSDLGIIVSGVSYNYVLDALAKYNTKAPILKLGSTYPIPRKLISSFVKNKKNILVVEELEPILETEARQIAKDVNCDLMVHGKNILPRTGEYNSDLLEIAIGKLLGKKVSESKPRELKIPKRHPFFCPGCPHMATYTAVKQAAPDAIYGGDIGCYLMGIFPPYNTQDFIYDMGAGMGISHGIKKATNQKIISFIGDSTFFHAGIPALINMVYNKSNGLVIVLDNRITAMTGLQANPGMGLTATGEQTTEVKIEDIAKAVGVKHVKVVNAYDTKELAKTIKEFLAKNELALIVSKGECALLRKRKEAGNL